jgi:hypothetical protein
LYEHSAAQRMRRIFLNRGREQCCPFDVNMARLRGTKNVTRWRATVIVVASE